MEYELRTCVWELTLRCNLGCIHCGSDAGQPRAHELTTEEALPVCDQLAALGATVVTFSGGEPLLREDWPLLAARLIAQGVRVELISNGLALDEAMADQICAAGLASVSLSIDGTEAIHDRLRGVDGSFQKAMDAAKWLRARGLPVGAVTQISHANLHTLGAIEDALVAGGFQGWQLQLTVPQGRAEGRALELAPGEVVEIERFLLASTRRIPLYGADDIGWMSRSEPLIRSGKRPTDQVFTGCHAGLSVVGLTADGTVRGCLSMAPRFDEGNVRDQSLAAIWNDPERFAYNRKFHERDLTGACAPCPFRRVCRGGCKSHAWATQKTVSENSYCLRVTRPE